jgi:hypothetical protein
MTTAYIATLHPTWFKELALSSRERKLLIEYLGPKPHPKEAVGKTMYDLLTHG